MLRTLALSLWLIPLAAHAGKALEGAQKAFDALSMDEAVPLFERALDEPGTREERIRAWRGLGVGRAFMGDSAGAKEAFTRLLIIDPEAKVETSLGPKISRPFEAAKKLARGKRTTLQLTRDSHTGRLALTLTEARPLADRLIIGWRVKGKAAFQRASGPTDHLLEVDTPPEEEVEAFGWALDDAGGVLFQQGTETGFLRLPAVARKLTPNPVVERVTPKVVVELPPAEVSSEEGGSALPYVLGGAVVVLGGGAAAAYLLTRPPELKLQPADRTGQLP